MPTVKTMYRKRQYNNFSFCCNHQSGDEKGYTADESGFDWNTEEEQVSSAYIKKKLCIKLIMQFMAMNRSQESEMSGNQKKAVSLR